MSDDENKSITESEKKEDMPKQKVAITRNGSPVKYKDSRFVVFLLEIIMLAVSVFFRNYYKFSGWWFDMLIFKNYESNGTFGKIFTIVFLSATFLFSSIITLSKCERKSILNLERACVAFSILLFIAPVLAIIGELILIPWFLYSLN